jgi:uncharacterized protein with HEPN domain
LPEADIIDALDWVAVAVEGRTEDAFVGEAAARLSSELIQKYPSVPWADIVGLRNVFVHQYFGVH